MTRLETRGTDRARWTAFATAVVIIAGSVLAAAQPAFASGPAVTAISPTSGLPGVVVGVTGTGFLGGCTSSSPTVFIGITQVNVLAGASDTLVHFQVPVMRDGFYDVQVQDCAGAVSPPVAADLFTLVLPARPKVTSVAPKTGTIGTTLTVTGTSFRLYCTDGRIPSVTFDDPNVFGDEVVVQDGGPEIVSWTDTKIVVHAPAHPASLLDILPRDCVGRQSIPSAADQFTYLAPKITSVAPTSGTAGTLVTVKGTGFRNGCTTGGPTLIIGGTGMPAGSAGVQSMTAVQIVVHVPPHLAGAVPVQVRDCAGDVSAVVTASKFTYLAPKVSSLAPTTGTIGTTVTVTGTGFTNDCVSGSSSPAVQFGGTFLAPGDPRILSSTATTIKVLAPPATAGKVDVRIFDCLGDESVVVTADKFTYFAPRVTSLAPTSGHGGTTVTVKGTGYLIGCSGGALPSVAVGTTILAGTDPAVSAITATQLKVVAPAHAAGTVDIRVIDCVGDVTAVVTADKFKYLV